MIGYCARGVRRGPSVPSPTAQIGRGPVGDAAPCQKAPRRTSSSSENGSARSRVLYWGWRCFGCSTARPVVSSSVRTISFPAPCRVSLKYSFAGWPRYMAWTTFHICPREGGLSLFHWKVVDGLRRARAQGPLSERGGSSFLGREVNSSHERESECSGCGGDCPLEGWSSRSKARVAGDVLTVRTRYAVRKGCGSLTAG